MTKQKEFGDFQTPDHLASKAVKLISELYPEPDRIVEPNSGLGAFLKAAYNHWEDRCSYEGYEINPNYVKLAAQALPTHIITLFKMDFFAQDWRQILNRPGSSNTLVIGNPPWVTNSELGLLGSDNLPKKANFQGLRGFDAKTGKSNFDIAEWMLIRLIEALPAEGALAMLCKTATARKVLRHFWKTGGGRERAYLFRIDAKAAFDVAVEACLFFISGKPSADRTALIYSGLDLSADTMRFGLARGELVSDVDAYLRYRHLDGGSPYLWRSGIKHDAASIMELSRIGDHAYENGLGEMVELEDDYLYPLLKSSDIGNGRNIPRKFVLVTQRNTGEETSDIARIAPQTWHYLLRHSALLDGRKSSIYQNRPRFSVFGVGEYSFAYWKLAISGLYKSLKFVIVPPYESRPVLLDDTCYSIPCGTETEARMLCDIFSSEPAQSFLSSLIFSDAKRPITVDVLRRLSVTSVAEALGKSDSLSVCIPSRKMPDSRGGEQLSLLM